jgi:hypothetical protein
MAKMATLVEPEGLEPPKNNGAVSSESVAAWALMWNDAGMFKGARIRQAQGRKLGKFVMIHKRKTHWTSWEAGDKRWRRVQTRRRLYWRAEREIEGL